MLRIIIILLILSSCTSHNVIEDELFEHLELHCNNQSINLNSTLDTLERLYLQEGLLHSVKPCDYRHYFQMTLDSGMVISLEDSYYHKILVELDLIKFNIDSLVDVLKKKPEFETSLYGRIISQIDSTVIAEGGHSIGTISKIYLSELSCSDFEHPYYRATVLLSLFFSHSNHYLKDDLKLLEKIPKRMN